MQVRIPGSDVPDVAFEVLNVDDVEADDCLSHITKALVSTRNFGSVNWIGKGAYGVQSDVSFSQPIAIIERPLRLRQIRFRAIQGSEQRADILLVRFLRAEQAIWSALTNQQRDGQVPGSLRSKSTLINPIVNIVVRPLIHLINLLLQILRQKLNIFILVREQVVEGMIQHPDNFRGLVGNDFVLDFVVEGWDGEAPGVVGFDGEIDVSQVLQHISTSLANFVTSTAIATEPARFARCRGKYDLQ